MPELSDLGESSLQVPPRRVRHNSRTRAKVIAEFRRTGRIDLACHFAGIDRSTHYEWLKRYEQYAEGIEEARQEVAGLLEDEAVRRAYHGTLKPISIGGSMVMVTEFSDRLLEFLLKCRNRAVFGDRFEHSAPGGKPLLTLSDVDRLLLESAALAKTRE